jgi:hypothetical protein
MMMGRRFAARRIGHNDCDHALSVDVRDYVFEDRLHLFRVL